MKRYITLVLVLCVLTVALAMTWQVRVLRSELRDRQQEIQGYKGQLVATEQEIARLKELAQLLKESNAMIPPRHEEPSVAVGHGGGRFTVLPSVVRPGDTIAIYNDEPNTEVSIFPVMNGERSESPIARFPGPKERGFVMYTIPGDLNPGEYLVWFHGPGGLRGEALIKVEGR